MRPVVTVVGLGPAGPDLVGEQARRLITEAGAAFLRTGRHPAAAAFPGVPTFDHHYEQADTFEEVYDRIVADLVMSAQVVSTTGGDVVYAVPGSPLVAETTVELLRADHRVDVHVVPCLSFLDLAWAALGVDPLATGVRLVDGARFAEQAAGQRGPLLVAQVWSPEILSAIKLSLDDADATEQQEVTVLSHLGLADESVVTVRRDDLDRDVTPDHLTSVWIPHLAQPVASEMVALDELVRRLRQDCPWDREQTHASLTRHLLEETYEVLDAIEALSAAEHGEFGDGGEDERAAVSHLEEELGDLLFQVYFHARLATEEGRFTLADVARGVHDKLVARHPHVFGDVVADDAGTVLSNWEALKKAEKGRTSVTDGIPMALPALALAAKLQRKAESVPGMPEASDENDRDAATAAMASLGRLGTEAPGDGQALSDAAGDLLWAVASIVRRSGVEPEDALRMAATRFRERIRRVEPYAGSS